MANPFMENPLSAFSGRKYNYLGLFTLDHCAFIQFIVGFYFVLMLLALVFAISCLFKKKIEWKMVGNFVLLAVILKLNYYLARIVYTMCTKSLN